ncbi:MAG: DUF6129 family protein [Pseudomonadota bacterium]
MINPQTIGQVLTLMARDAGSTLLDLELAAHLREACPGISMTVCSEDDIPPHLTAAASNAVCALYYVDGRGHCHTLTTDAEAATGLVVARRGDDA